MNFIALPIRLVSTWPMRSDRREGGRGTSGAGAASARFFLAAMRREQFDQVFHHYARIEFDRFDLELAGFDLGEIQNVVDDGQQGVGGLAHGLGVSRCSAVSSVCRAEPVMPMTPFMGVRISWLMLARNSLLAWLAASAASFASSDAVIDRARTMARARLDPSDQTRPATARDIPDPNIQMNRDCGGLRGNLPRRRRPVPARKWTWSNSPRSTTSQFAEFGVSERRRRRTAGDPLPSAG